MTNTDKIIMVILIIIMAIVVGLELGKFASRNDYIKKAVQADYAYYDSKDMGRVIWRDEKVRNLIMGETK
jgi:hypothetical protein